jgi:hypothetical protein
MATKGERFKAEAQRAAHATKPRKDKHEPAGKRAARRGRYKERIPNPTSHNEAPRAARKSSYELEVSLTARPSRKSGRKSHNRQKTDSSLRIKEMNRNASPRARAGRPSGNPV